MSPIRNSIPDSMSARSSPSIFLPLKIVISSSIRLRFRKFCFFFHQINSTLKVTSALLSVPMHLSFYRSLDVLNLFGWFFSKAQREGTRVKKKGKKYSRMTRIFENTDVENNWNWILFFPILSWFYFKNIWPSHFAHSKIYWWKLKKIKNL